MYALTTQGWIFVYPYCSVNESVGVVIADTFVRANYGPGTKASVSFILRHLILSTGAIITTLWKEKLKDRGIK